LPSKNAQPRRRIGEVGLRAFTPVFDGYGANPESITTDGNDLSGSGLCRRTVDRLRTSIDGHVDDHVQILHLDGCNKKHDIVEADGFRFPSKRRAFPRGPGSKPIRDLLLISIDLSDFHVEKSAR
jgi:hypothetical protein